MQPLLDTILKNKDSLEWPRQPAGILIMGKRQGTKKENKQLWARTALAAALWYSAPQPKPYLLFVARDVHGPDGKPDTQVVKSMLVQKFGVPADFIIIRRYTNCTLLEVRATRMLSRIYRLSYIFAVTHLYHAPRAQRYLNEVLPGAAVIPVHPEILDEIAFPVEALDLFDQIQAIIDDSLPGHFDLIREQSLELILNLAHNLDSRGRLERRLAKLLRPGAYEGDERIGE